MTDEAPSPPRKRRLAFWRTERGQKFVREVGSVVLGVLIALGLGAIATEIGWQIEVTKTRFALADELGEIVGQAHERMQINTCIETRLDQLADIVDAAEKSGKLPPLGEIGAPTFRTWTRGVYDNAVSAGTTAHFPRDDQDNLSAIYEYVSVIGANDQRSLELWTKLAAITGPGRALGQEEAVSLRDTIGLARVNNRLIQISGLRLEQVSDAFGLSYSRKAAEQYARIDHSKDPICQPIPNTGPAHSGQAPLDGSIERVRQNPITRDTPS